MIFDPETNEVVNSVSGGKRVWIGAHRVGPLVDPKPRNDQWTWIDGSPLEYSNWVSNQPDNWVSPGKYDGEYCGMINPTRKLHFRPILIGLMTPKNLTFPKNL